MKEYEFHPYASVVPMLGQVELNALAADIQGNGLRHKIVLLDGMILDGRNRYKACGLVGVEPEFEDFNGNGDPIAFIVSENLCRRHLTQSQKALAVAKIADLPRGNPNLKNSENPNKSQIRTNAQLGKSVEQAAREVEVSPRTVVQAKQVLREAPAETVAEIEQGKKSVATAVKEIKQAKKTTLKEDREDKPKRIDKTGLVIPDPVIADWDEAEEFRATLNELHRIKLSIEKAVEAKKRPLRFLDQSFLIDLTNAWKTLKEIFPYAVCPTCQGRTRSKCTVCKELGYVPEFGYKHWFPQETIELRERAIKK